MLQYAYEWETTNPENHSDNVVEPARPGEFHPEPGD